MSANDELRRLLEERGVEWRKTPHYSSESQDNETVFAGDGIEWYANDHLNGKLGLRAARYEVSPEQAIAATLGHRTTTRHGKFRTKYGRSVPCCECCGYGIGDTRWHYCPSCGAEVVE